MSAQINEHNVAEDAHANRFVNYLPLSGGTITGELSFGNEFCYITNTHPENENNYVVKMYNPNAAIVFGNEYTPEEVDYSITIKNAERINLTAQNGLKTDKEHSVIDLHASSIRVKGEGDFYGEYIPTLDNELVNKKYVDDQIAAIPTPDVSAQIEAHNTSTAAHANMHWLTADDEMLSSIEPDGSIDADTLEGHPASYFATQTDLENVNVDLTNYYTKEEVDAKITQIQQLIDQAAALVDEINGEVI